MAVLMDTVAGFTLSEAAIAERPNELAQLQMMWHGLEMLAGHIRIVESKLPFDPKFKTMSLGGLSAQDNASGLMCFHWYSVTGCNMIRLLGWLRRQFEPQAPEPIEYLRSVAPELKAFRDKVAAHFALVSTRDDDGYAIRAASTMNLLCECDGKLRFGEFMVTTRSSGVVSDSSAIIPWGITETHDRLRKRFALDK